MTGQEAAQRLASEMISARNERLCTAREYITALPLFHLTANQWINNGKDIREDQYQNVWNVISKDWERKELSVS